MRSDDFEGERLAALEREIAELKLRNAVLEDALTKYRLQVHGVMTSLSWRVTHPLRAGVAWSRRARAKALGMPAKVRDRKKITTPTTGLFFPDTSQLAHLVDSPLLSGPLDASVTAPLRTAPAAKAKVLVVAHVYYPEIWVEIADHITRIPEEFDLVVTLVKGKADELSPHITGQFPNAHVMVVDNHGRDIGPLIDLANNGWFEDYDAVLKVHTKRSPHRADGDVWRLSLLDGLLPSADGVAQILQLLRADRDVGVVCAPRSYLGAETWGPNLAITEALAARLPLAFDASALRYPAGSMYWIRPFLLQRLADLALTPFDFAVEANLLDGTTAHAVERFLGVMTQAAGLAQVETSDVASRLAKLRKRTVRTARVLAFYLPQIHQLPGRDASHGEGITEWTNVARARPIFEAQRHPIRPGEIGAYDLRDPSVMSVQAGLARRHGIDGFVLYHYWSDGRLLTHAPLDNLLVDRSIDLPFALCWANDESSRECGGLDKNVLLPQTYAAGWADRFYDDVLPALMDPRYLRVAGLPLLVVYRAGQIPGARAVFERWKSRAATDGLGGLHLLGVTPSRESEAIEGSAAAALDGLIRFPPGSGVGLQQLHPAGYVQGPTGAIYSYEAAAQYADLSTLSALGLRIHPGVMPGWDNTARRAEAAYVFHGANPLTFRRWLAKASAAAVAAGPDPLVFLNAWNGWAEGAYVEPDARFGRARLQAVADVQRPDRLTP